MSDANVAHEMVVDIDGCTVTIELICTSKLGARVLYEDVLSRIEGGGLVLKLRGQRAKDEALK